MAPGKLTIRPKGATLTRDTDTFSKMDPYLVFTIGSQTFQSKTCEGGGLKPTWDDQFIYQVTTEEEIRVEVWEYDSLSSNDLVGGATLPIKSIKAGVKTHQIEISFEEGSAGVVEIEIDFSPTPSASEHHPSSAAPKEQWTPPKVEKEDVKKSAEEVFAQFDRDKSGSLEMSEFYSLLAELCPKVGSTVPSKAEVDNLLQKYDKNSDQKFNLKEFKKIVKKMFGLKE
eukprot:TRINITY_DN4888_c0_g1_i1.p1 TRINITY_DN4888_c0_g1~~TRINITY_DN4888_c0_g1_i1.p1  ORF type:complete len:227 (+),score=53.14 TRINITY_DN4888_c0_g1_i1:103-783(+)